jgi:hypothetical protein
MSALKRLKFLSFGRREELFVFVTPGLWCRYSLSIEHLFVLSLGIYEAALQEAVQFKSSICRTSDKRLRGSRRVHVVWRPDGLVMISIRSSYNSIANALIKNKKLRDYRLTKAPSKKRSLNCGNIITLMYQCGEVQAKHDHPWRIDTLRFIFIIIIFIISNDIFRSSITFLQQTIF